MKTIAEIIGALIAILIIGVVLSALLSLPVWLLWNWVAPIVSSGFLPKITWLQAWGLLMLCSFLFKSTPAPSVSK